MKLLLYLVIGLVVGGTAVWFFAPKALAVAGISPTLRDAYYCGKSEGVSESHPEITVWTDRDHIREKFHCSAVAAIVGDPML